jgi:predicted Rossmann fold flavoprotein
MNSEIKILIIGGGAAGMTAAIIASLNGAQVVILEQLNRVGKKILATGNGRCNITNSRIDISRYHGKNVKFAYGALNQFDRHNTIGFFEDLGLCFVEEDEGKIYPASLQASSVLDVLRYEMKRLGVEEICDSKVVSISRSNSGFTLKLKDGRMVHGDKVIVATGGKANPGLGSNGSGYDLVKPLGHKIVEPFPALVQLRLNAQFLKALSGVKLIGEASIEAEGRIMRRERGEILFTNYGVSGPPVIQLSRCVGEQLNLGKKPVFILDMFPNINHQELLALLRKRSSLRGEKPLDFSFVGLINKRLINVLLKESGIVNIKMPCNTVGMEHIEAIASKMKRLDMEIIGTQSWSEAQVTAGGVDVTDINPKTMESKIIPGLYFAGEIMDIDGDCGGFNLQWAWSSGYVAGLHASKR